MALCLHQIRNNFSFNDIMSKLNKFYFEVGMGRLSFYALRAIWSCIDLVIQCVCLAVGDVI